MRKLVSFVVMLCMFLSLAGCNTVAGFGRDLTAAGNKIKSMATH